MRGSPPRRTEDPAHMREASELAERGWGRVSPNPLVGAVVARGRDVVGRGWHAEFGADHAEVMALREAGPRADGATLYVTLEPCAHQGKTPPCTEAIRRAGIRRVVIACRDPDPEAGGGAGALRTAGLDVEIGLAGAAAKRLNAPFLWRHRTGTPFGALKLALSLDAKLGIPDTRASVSGPAAWERVHRLRAAHDAILVGRRTAEIDDPLLTARGEVQPRRPPIRAVLDPQLRLAPTSQLARTVQLGPVWS
ncbi:MAG: bifunctional diaminohydroxyphosphoribosylaminopyrimidine deaminase/5-amino-6-(5-phosphoribosylamino)uracil reductase RibD, partial [Gemmatimonadota bacterium]